LLRIVNVLCLDVNTRSGVALVSLGQGVPVACDRLSDS
jgi:hypothetical protein